MKKIEIDEGHLEALTQERDEALEKLEMTKVLLAAWVELNDGPVVIGRSVIEKIAEASTPIQIEHNELVVRISKSLIVRVPGKETLQ